MPIADSVDPDHRVVWVAVRRTPSVADIRRYYAGVEAHPAYDPSFARVIDACELETPPPSPVVDATAAYVRMSAARGDPPGPRAVLVRPGVCHGVTRLL